MIHIGDNIQGYTVIRMLGEGGMGIVWKVTKGEKSYALKICNSTEEVQKKRFEREFRLMNVLDCPYVLKVFEQGQLDDGTQFLIEELGECTLTDIVKRGLTTKQKYDFSMQICEGLAYIHQQGETHRDIKPANILIVDGIAKISDFGIGRFIDRDTTTLTTTTETWGTYGYAAPELYKEDGEFRNGSIAIDIYALGGVLYYIFSEGSLPQFFSYKEVSADIYPVLAKCKENNTNERYQSVNDIIKAINGVMLAKSRYRTMMDLYNDRDKLLLTEWMENALQILFGSQGIGELISNFRIVSYNRNALNSCGTDEIDKLIRFILRIFEEDKSYWLQFEDTEVMAKMAVILCPKTKDIDLSLKLLDLCFKSSIGANRWEALRTLHNDLFSKWDETTILPYIAYIQSNKDSFEEYARIINVAIPPLIRHFFDTVK